MCHQARPAAQIHSEIAIRLATFCPKLQPSKLTGAPALQRPAGSRSSPCCIPRLWPCLQRPLSSHHGCVISAVESVAIRRCRGPGGQLVRLCSLSLRRQRLLQVLWPARLLGWMGNLCASLHVRSLQPLQALRFARLLDRLAASLPVRPLLLPLLLPLRVALALLLPLCSRLLLLEKMECSTLLLGSMLLPMQLQDMVLYLLQVEQLLRRHTGAAWGEHSREQVGRDILQAHRDQSAHQEPKVGEAQAGRHVRPDACSDCLPAGSCSHGELKSSDDICCLACNKFT